MPRRSALRSIDRTGDVSSICCRTKGHADRELLWVASAGTGDMLHRSVAGAKGRADREPLWAPSAGTGDSMRIAAPIFSICN
jgi:hypothetical protein